MDDSALGAAYAVEIGRLCAAIHSALSTSEVEALIAAGADRRSRTLNDGPGARSEAFEDYLRMLGIRHI
jgi:hypothetical protein